MPEPVRFNFSADEFKQKFLENLKEHLGKGLNKFAHDIGARASRGIQGKWCGFAMQEVLKETFEEFGVDKKLVKHFIEAAGTDNLSAAKTKYNGIKNGTYESKNHYEPEEGDIAIILRSKKTHNGKRVYSGHVTAVESVDDNIMHCVGGNVTNRVGHEKHNINSRSVKGFINVGNLFEKVMEHHQVVEKTKDVFSNITLCTIEANSSVKPLLSPALEEGLRKIKIAI